MLHLLLPFALSLSDVDKVADVMEDIAETVSWIHPRRTAPSVAALLRVSILTLRYRCSHGALSVPPDPNG